MTAQEALEYFVEFVAAGKRHPLYKRTVEIADECRVLLGDSKAQADLLRSYTLMETDDEKAQRIRLTNSITQAVLGPSRSYLDKVIRCDGQTQIVEGPGEIKVKLLEHFSRFYRGETLKQYCFEAARYATELDPNFWTVFQYSTKTNPATGATVITDIYPIEVSSKDVVDWGFDKSGELEYFAFQSSREVLEDNKKTSAPEYFLYGIGFVLHLLEIRPQWVEVNKYDGYETVTSNTPQQKIFQWRIFENNTSEVPAIRWSAYLSDIDHNEIGVPLFQPAIGFLKDLIRDKSFFDVSKVLHMRPEKAQYVKACTDVDDSGENQCEGGFYGGLRDEKHRCKKCGGSGMMLASTEQRVITLAWPENESQVFELSKLTHYFDRPINAVEFFDRQIQAATRAVTLAIFNQQAVDAANLATVATATQSRIEYDKINDRLQPFASLIEKAFEKAWRVGFNYYNQKAQVAILSFPSDFKLQSLSELIADLKAAKDSSAPYQVIQSIQMDMLAKSYRNSPEMVNLFAAIENHRPFKSKSDAVAAMILQQRATDDPERQLYENWDSVVLYIQENDPAFNMRPLEEQRNMMYALAARYAQNVKYVDNTADFPGNLESLFTNLNEQEAED